MLNVFMPIIWPRFSELAGFTTETNSTDWWVAHQRTIKGRCLCYDVSPIRSETSKLSDLQDTGEHPDC
jgi:hypothetical protein